MEASRTEMLIHMFRRRPLAAGLSVVAIALMIVGVVALAFDSGSNGGTGFGSPSAHATATAASTSAPPASSPSLPVASRSPSTSPPAGPSAPPSPSAEPSGEASPSATPNPAVFVTTPAGIVWRGSDGTIVPVPEVPGLIAQLQSGHLAYIADAGNRYSLRAGTYAGEFVPQVTMGRDDGSSAQTGGLVLTGPVVTRLTNDALAAAPTDADRWIVALPVDVRGAGGSEVSVSFDRYGLAGWQNTPRVIVRFGGTLPVTVAVPLNHGFHVLVESLGVARWQVIDPLRLTLPTDTIDPAHAMNELLVYGSGTPSLTRDAFFNARAAVGSFIMRVAGDVSVSLVVPGSHADLGPDKVLTVGDVPVFVASL